MFSFILDQLSIAQDWYDKYPMFTLLFFCYRKVLASFWERTFYFYLFSFVLKILVGSSMGGWLMLLAALARPEKTAALVGISTAADHFVTAFNSLPIEVWKSSMSSCKLLKIGKIIIIQIKAVICSKLWTYVNVTNGDLQAHITNTNLHI